MAIDSPAPLITQAGPATGIITGINHLQLIAIDFDASIRFYRDVMGFTAVRSKGDYPAAGRGYQILKNVFFDLGGGSMLSVIRIAGMDITPGDRVEPSVSADWLWPGEVPHRFPRKIDHLAFNVNTHDQLVWFRKHLLDHDIKVSKVITREDEAWIESIYFYDPNGFPLEIATFDWEHPKWKDHDPKMWFWDTDVEALHSC